MPDTPAPRRRLVARPGPPTSILRTLKVPVIHRTVRRWNLIALALAKRRVRIEVAGFHAAMRFFLGPPPQGTNKAWDSPGPVLVTYQRGFWGGGEAFVYAFPLNVEAGQSQITFEERGVEVKPVAS